jgi:outer membrane protein assembly factor BamB
MGYTVMLLVGSDDTKLYSFTPQGQLLWTYPLGAPLLASPCVDSESHLAYVITTAGALSAIHTSGSLNWTTHLGHQDQVLFQSEGEPGLQSSPAASGDSVFVAWEDVLYAVWKANGTVRWKFQAESQLQTTPAVATTPQVRLGDQQ